MYWTPDRENYLSKTAAHFLSLLVATSLPEMRHIEENVGATLHTVNLCLVSIKYSLKIGA